MNPSPFPFEPTEKRLAVQWNTLRPELRSTANGLHSDFAVAISAAAGATILSSIKSETLDLHLLSESTLLMTDEGFILITCGQTPLIRAALVLIESSHGEHVAHLSFSRQRELFGHQLSTFTSDAEVLRNCMKSHPQAGLFKITSSLQSNTDYLVIAKKGVASKDPSVTRAYFEATVASPPLVCPAAIRYAFGASLLKRDWKMDDHIFTPWGYSMNSHCGEDYIIVHASLVADKYYVSVESNCDVSWLMDHLVNQLKVEEIRTAA